VIDELHHYRGIFGSHVANVIRRLRRVCRFYGANPVFVMCSATIANPAELASRLVGEEVVAVDRSGAPAGPREFIFYNPPVVNKELGIRRSSVLEARRLATLLLANEIQTIVFARSRVTTEVLLTYLKEAVAGFPGLPQRIRGYRGGYLPLERRDIERGLREGRVLGVVSTDALELGVDIGGMEACVMVGYPGSVASTWQQAGRAGRRRELSLAILIASSSPVDQYIITHPDFFFGRAPEFALVNPDNLYVLLSHLKCAAFELPFANGEDFGVASTGEALSYLEEQGLLHRAGDRWHWAAPDFPAEEISLRSAASENFVIIDITDEGRRRVIGQVDRFAAPMLVHQEAIYIHGGRQYHVDLLDYKEKKAYVKEVKVDYYTDANLAVNLRVLDVFQTKENDGLRQGLGEALVTAMVTMFKKIKLHTHENIGWGRLHLPEEQIQTSATWFSIREAVSGRYQAAEMETALAGLANLIGNVAPLLLLCDPRDVHVVPQVRSPFTQEPTVFFHDHYPGGIGLAEKLYELLPRVWRMAGELVVSCGCAAGCPACVGPAAELGRRAKELTRRLLSEAAPG
jgi:DEAD/DEAH box helicase domain-containing protein